MSVTPPRNLSDIPKFELSIHMPYHIAFVIDGVVEQVFHVDERVAAILTSNPTVVQCADPSEGGPENDWTYNAETKEFAPPVL